MSIYTCKKYQFSTHSFFFQSPICVSHTHNQNTATESSNTFKKKKMAINRKSHATIFFTILFAILVTLSTIQFGAATRPMHGEQWLKKHFPRIESLQRGPVTPSAGSPCTHNTVGSGHCTMNEMNFVGRANHQPPPPFPSSVIDHSKASN
jgi:hypothetical protein